MCVLCAKSLCSFQLFATIKTIAHQSPLSTSVHGILQAENPFPSPGNVPNFRIEPSSLMSPALAGRCLPLAPPGKYISYDII